MLNYLLLRAARVLLAIGCLGGSGEICTSVTPTRITIRDE
jgi:hypothetical protein